MYIYVHIHAYILFIRWKQFDIYLVHAMTAKQFISLLYSFEAPDTAYKKLKKLTSFNNTTLNKRVQKAPASWVFRIHCLFDFQKVDSGKVAEVFSQCLNGCVRYCWVLVKQLIYPQWYCKQPQIQKALDFLSV